MQHNINIRIWLLVMVSGGVSISLSAADACDARDARVAACLKRLDERTDRELSESTATNGCSYNVAEVYNFASKTWYHAVRREALVHWCDDDRRASTALHIGQTIECREPLCMHRQAMKAGSKAIFAAKYKSEVEAWAAEREFDNAMNKIHAQLYQQELAAKKTKEAAKLAERASRYKPATPATPELLIISE